MIQKFSWLEWVRGQVLGKSRNAAERRESRPRQAAPAVIAESLESRTLLAAVITTTLTDTLQTDADGDGVADPGDQIRYTVTVQNTGDATATNLTLQELINDPNLTLTGNVNISPLAVNDSYTAVANTQLVVGNATPLSGPAKSIAGNVLSNDTEFLGDTFAISTFDATSALGGSITMVTSGPNAGSFTYTPAAGSSGTDTFTYTIRDAGINGIAGDGDDLISVATVSITIGTQEVWYVDSSFAGSSTGTSTNPFKSLADVSGASGPDGNGDIIYVRTGSGTYTGGIELQTNQSLWGENQALIVDGFTLQAAGTDPTIASSAGDGITLATGNSIRGLTIGDTAGFDISGTSVGSLFITNVNATGTGGILSISSGGAVNVSLDTATSTSSTNAIILNNVTGSVTASSGAISGASGTDVSIAGGTATVSIGSSITSSAGGSIEVSSRGAGSNNVTFSGALNITGGTGILVHDNTAGSVIFSNSSKVINMTSTGVNLTNNTGSTISFTGGGLAITSSSGGGLLATGGGTVNVTGTSNTINATSNVALRIENTTIGGSNVTFQSISSGAGNNVGIILDTTGTLGGLVVTGTGSTNGSGGNITGKTGSDGSTSTGIGIYLNNTSNISLSNMTLSTFSNFAIRGNGVNNLTMNNVDISGTNGSNAALDEGSVAFGYLTSVDTSAGLTGSVLIDNCTFLQGSVEDTFRIRNGSGTLNRVTISNSLFESQNTIGDALKLETANGAVINATINNNDFTSAAGDLFQFNSIGAGTNDLVFTNNDLSNNNAAIATGGGGVTIGGGDNGGSLTFNMTGNTFRDSDGHAILIAKSTGAGTFSGTFSNNTIGVAGTADSGSRAGSGIKIQNAGLGTVTVLVSNNQIYQYNNFGIELLTGGGATAMSGNLNATITGNTISNPGTGGLPMNGIHVNGGTIPGDTYAIALDIGGAGALANTVTGSGANGGTDIRVRQRQSTTVQLRGYTGANNDNTAVQTYLTGRNNSATTLASNTVPTGGGFVNTPGGNPVAQPLTLSLDPLFELPSEDEPTLSEPLPPPVSGDPAETEPEVPTGQPETPVVLDDGILSQEELDLLVAAAIARWEASGLTPEQSALLHSVTFVVADLPAWQLGQATFGNVIIDATAAGNTWFIDATPLDDSEFSGTGTQRLATAAGGAANRVDALTVILHELGHQLGLGDVASADGSADLMSGWLHQGERRLPTAGQAAGAVARTDDEGTPEFLFSTLSLGSLPAGHSLTIQYTATVATLTNGIAPSVSSQVRVQGDGGINVTSSAETQQLDSIVIGNLVYRDADNSGTFNGGDTGINGVTVNLYVDVNTNGVLDVGDGVAIASTTTAGGGLYSFNVLPGEYLVEIAHTNFQSGGPLEGMVSYVGTAADPDNNIDNDDNGVDNASPAVNGIVSKAITVNYNTEPTADGTGQFDINSTLDFGFISNIPPVVTTSGGNTNYGENNGFTAIDSGITVVDSNNPTLASATVTITDYVAGQDLLGFTNDGLTMGNIAIQSNVGGVLTLISTGATATVSEWQAALRAVGYSNSSDNPSPTTRTVQFVVNDGVDPSNVGSKTINIVASNDAPSLANPGAITFTEGDAATAIAAGITVSDLDNTTLASSTITITNYVAGEDVIAFTNDGSTMGNIAVQSNVGGVLTLVSAGNTATLAEWQSALRAVTYENTSNDPDLTQREVEFVVNDGTDPSNTLTSTISIDFVNDAPVLANPGSITYTENDAPTAIATAITVSDPDDSSLATATVTITNYVAGQDVLGFVNDGSTMGNIAIQSNVGGVLTLISTGGTANLAEWQAALRAVTYENTSDSPDTTQREVEFVVDDGGTPSTALTSTIDITAENDVPVLANPGAITFTEGDGPTAIATAITVSDLDNATLASATVTLTNYVAGEDVLAFTNDGSTMGNIAVQSNVGGVLTLVSAGGTATLAEWQAALRSVTYENTSDNPDTTQRDVDFAVDDGTDTSNSLTSTIDITAVNDVPVLDGIESSNLNYAPGGAEVAVTSTLTIADLDSANLSGATITISDGFLVGDQLKFTDTPNITGVYNAATGVLTLTGVDTLANYEAALRSITYVSTSQIPTQRTISFTVTDGTDPSNTVSRTLGGYAQFDGTTVTIYGTPLVDQVLVDQGAALNVTVNGVGYSFSGPITHVQAQLGDGNDTVEITSLFSGTTATILGEGGNDTLRAAATVSADLSLDGGQGNDLLIGGAGNDTLTGGQGNDWLSGGDGDDSLIGGIGNDVYAFSDTAINETDTITELTDEGVDTLNFSGMTTGVVANLTYNQVASMTNRLVRVAVSGQGANLENITGGSAADVLTGNASNNQILGGGGNDTLNGGDGNDYLDGGEGNDLITGGNQNDILVGGNANDILRGNAGRDILRGGEGDDVLEGGEGDDQYQFAAAITNQTDTITELAGGGIDTLDFSALATSVVVNLGSDTLTASMDHRIVKSTTGSASQLENVSGGSGNDTLTGNGLDNLLSGNGGNDTISGEAGNDVLLGGQGNDVLKGISGRNMMIGGAGADLLLGGTGEDLMMAGSTLYESDPAILAAMQAEWNSVATYQVRVDHLRGTSGGGLNTSFVFNAASSDTDTDADYLTGGSGRDWFLAGTTLDTVTDKAVDEVFTNIDSWS